MQYSKIDEALAARNRPGQNPTPDFHAMRERRAREMEPPPIDFDHRTVRGDTPAAVSARQTLQVLTDTWRTIAEAAAGDEPLPQLGKVAQAALSTGLRRVDNTLADVGKAIKTAEANIHANTQPPVQPTLAAEVRSEVARLVRGKTSKFEQVVENAKTDVRVASSILSAPAFLSGLTQKQYDTVKTMAESTFAPDAVANLKTARGAEAKLTTARDRAIQALGPKLALWQNPESTRMGKLREIARGQ